MKLFVKNTCLFFSVCAILFFLMILVLNIKSNPLKSNKFLINNANKIEVLVMGTSHALNGINPEFLSFDAINLAKQNRLLQNDIAIIEKNLSYLNKLKAIVMPADYFTLWFNKDVGSFSSLDRLHFNLKPTIKDHVNHLKLCNFNCEKYPSKNGFIERNNIYSEKDSSEKTFEGKKRVSDWHEHWMPNNEFNKTVKLATSKIDDFIILCDSLNIEVIFVKFPVTNYVRKHYLDSLNKYDLLSYAKQKNWNTINLDNLNFDESLFDDQDHLNKNGAKKATLIIDSALKNLLD